MKIVEFPLYNLFNIPEALRKLANEIERGEPVVEHIVICFDTSDGVCGYRVFGKDFTRAYAVGLLEFTKPLIMGMNSSE